MTDDLVGHVDGIGERRKLFSDFYYFEPFDVKVRSQRILDLALEDGVDLRAPAFTSLYGEDPHDFQSGYFRSCNKMRIVSGGSQTGKSICPRIEILIMSTGELPFTFRHDLGVDTGIKRHITPENLKQMVHRFGRHDSSTAS